jgi:pectinesterase
MRCVLLFCAATLLAQNETPGREFRIALAGDSTVAEQNGWGPGLRAAFGAGVEVKNLALNGRSSKSFRAEGAWLPIAELHARLVLVQFGHNDCAGKGPDRETNPKTTYRENMLRYVDEVRATGATPVLVTSIVRRNFDSTGKIMADCLVPFVREIRKIAAERKIPLIDMYELTRRQAEQLGPKASLELGPPLPADGTPDTTHLGLRGQREIGRLVAQELVRIEPALKPLLREDAPAPIHYVVAQDGSGDSKTIQYAVDHAPPTLPGQRLIIEIRPGIYRERLSVPKDRARVTFRGSDAKTTVIVYEMAAFTVAGTFHSATVNVQGDEFEAERITFQNTFKADSRPGGQAVALHIYSDRAVFRECRFLGWQDTLYAAWGRQYYKDCYIEGHVDFIFGNATAVFENCEIKSLGAGYIAAHSRTVADAPTGYVFLNCRLTGENTGKGVFLGRPWRPYSRVVYINCEMGDHIRPEGWDHWGSAANEKTAYFGEFGSSGPGGKMDGRVPWSHQLTPKEVEAYQPAEFLGGGDLWRPGAR